MRTERSKNSGTAEDKPSGRESPPLTKMSLSTLHKQNPTLWEGRFGEYLQSGLFKAQPELYWVQVILRELESEGIPMRRAYEAERALASITPRMQGVEIPSYDELMTTNWNPQPSEEPVT